MAKQLTNFHPPKPAGRPTTYPWDKWLNGSWWAIYPGEDFHCSIQNMIDTIRRSCRSRGLRANIYVMLPSNLSLPKQERYITFRSFSKPSQSDKYCRTKSTRRTKS